MTTRCTVFDTQLGHVAMAWTDRGLRRVMIGHPSAADAFASLGSDGTAAARALPALIRTVKERLVRHLGGAPQDYEDVTLDRADTTPFRQRVYAALQASRAGETLSYGELAARAGTPGAARAIGSAMAENPWAVVVPCHRVLGAGQRLGRYSSAGGSFTKAKLLSLEGGAFRGTPGGVGELAFDATEAVRTLRARDPALAAVMDRVGPLRLEPRGSPTTFLALCRAIVYQQLSGKAAGTIFGRVAALAATGALRPADILAASDQALRGAGLSGAKARALRDLAERCEAGTVPSLRALRAMPEAAIFEALLPIRGVGRWSVQMLLMFDLGLPDVLAPGDLGLRKGYAEAFGGRLPTEDEIEAQGARWRPYRTVASWYLWRVLDLPR